MVDTQTKSKN